MNEIYVFATCRETAASADGATWFQTFPPYGRYLVGGTIKDAPKDAEFVFDEAAAKAIMDSFKTLASDPKWPGILVDEEHYSLDPAKSSAAMAWAKEIRQESDGSLWTRWEFTPKGRELWETKTLLNRSPAFACTRTGGAYRPARLVSIGMTNTPHFTGLSTLAAARAAASQTQKGKTHMEKVLAELGLGADATEDAALAAPTAWPLDSSSAPDTPPPAPPPSSTATTAHTLTTSLAAYTPFRPKPAKPSTPQPSSPGHDMSPWCRRACAPDCPPLRT